MKTRNSFTGFYFGVLLLIGFISSCPTFGQILGGGNPNITPYYSPPLGWKSQDRIGPELSALYNIYLTGGTVASNDIFRITGTNVLIDIAPLPGKSDELLNIIRGIAYGLTNEIDNGLGSVIITGQFPILNLLKLNLLGQINYARPAYTPVSSSGLTTTAGDIAMGSDKARNQFNVKGQGIKVGVISDSYNTQPGNPAQIDVQNYDLPGIGNPNNNTPVDVVKECNGKSSDEGRAMLQIIHDVAPKASLAFRSGFFSEGDFAVGINELRQAGCDIIVDDISYITEPFFQDGQVARAIDNVTANGAIYFSAAGNYGSKSYQHVFVPGSFNAHNFGGGDVLQNISLKPGSYTIVLQWDDFIYSNGQATGAKNDLDIYLINDNGSVLLGTNRNNIGGDPIEVLPFNVSSNTATNIKVIRASGTDNMNFKYVVFRGDITINEYNEGNSTIVGHPNAASAITVGAVLYSNTPAFGVTAPTVASFSSRGGTPVNGVVRNKPDITAPNGGNTTVNMGGPNIDGDAFYNFFGTSAAAPHAAGVAAMILEAKKKFYGQVSTSENVRQLMQQTSLDMYSTGLDFNSGSGFIQADVALASMINPAPVITRLIVPDGAVPGNSEFTVIVEGEDFTKINQPIIYFRGQPLPTRVLSSSQISADIPSFVGNPAVQVYNPPLSPSQLDGGLSNALFFFEKTTLTITANNFTKRYGESLPTFTTAITGLPPELTLDDVGLSSMQFETPTTSISNVGFYFIRPYINALPDSAVLERFDFVFVNGLLSVQKVALVVQPNDLTLNYGDPIQGISYRYLFDSTGMPQASFIRENITREHASGFTNVVGVVSGKAMVNDEAIVNGKAMVNRSFLTSAKAMVNTKAMVNGTMFIDVDAASLLDSAGLETGTALVNGKAMVNTKAMVNGKAMVNSKAMVNADAMVNGKAMVNSEGVNEESNSQAIVIVTEADTLISDLYSITLVTDTVAGEHWIVPGTLVSNNFNISYRLGKLTILPDTLAVKGSSYVINDGDSLPAYASAVTGFVNHETEQSVSIGISYTLRPEYAGPGIYSIVPNLQLLPPANYVVDYVNGTLYVNPQGPTVKPVNPSLRCVEIVSDSSGLNYLAHFEFQNDNSTPVFVPRGPDNFLSGTHAFAGNPVELFMPGKGSFDVLFNGSKLVWNLTSNNNKGQKSLSAEASSGSFACVNENTNNRITSNDAQKVQAEENTGLKFYPNPVKDKLVIELDNTATAEINLFNSQGKSCKTEVVTNSSSGTIEIDMASMSDGFYVLRLKVGEYYKTLRVVKIGNH